MLQMLILLFSYDNRAHITLFMVATPNTFGAQLDQILKWKYKYFRELKVTQCGWNIVLILLIRSVWAEINRKANLHCLKKGFRPLFS